GPGRQPAPTVTGEAAARGSSTPRCWALTQGSTPAIVKVRRGAVVARKAHNLEVSGSNPLAATRVEVRFSRGTGSHGPVLLLSVPCGATHTGQPKGGARAQGGPDQGTPWRRRAGSPGITQG